MSVHNNNFQTLTPEEISTIDEKVTSKLGALNIKKLISVPKLIQANAQAFTWGKRCNPKNTKYLMPIPNRVATAKSNKIFNPAVILNALNDAYNYLLTKTNGKKILFVGTSNDTISELIKSRAAETNSLYITKRWLGGLLTNFNSVVNSINRLNALNELKQSSDWSAYSKKEQVLNDRTINKLEALIGGVKNYYSASNANLGRKLPNIKNFIGAIVVTDYVRENIAIKEAINANIPIISLHNSNCFPKQVYKNGLYIPINTGSMQAVWLAISVLFDAVAARDNLPQAIVGKVDSEIILPANRLKTAEQQPVVTHKKFGKSL